MQSPIKRTTPLSFKPQSGFMMRCAGCWLRWRLSSTEQGGHGALTFRIQFLRSCEDRGPTATCIIHMGIVGMMTGRLP
jgi:hypothetical protein